jgi:excisionase family DNA binding protein
MTPRPQPSNSPSPDTVNSTNEWKLHTPAEAAELLAVKESWLRRKAGQRLIPCTFVGKHLRFSAADLRTITEAGHRSPRGRNRLK